MSKSTKRDFLATIQAFEAGAFRVAHVARQLLADHPDLPVREIRLLAHEAQDPAASDVRLEISVRCADDARVWADALGTTVTVTFYDHGSTARAFEYHVVRATVGGVGVEIKTTRIDLTDAEIEAWRAQNRKGGEGQ